MGGFFLHFGHTNLRTFFERNDFMEKHTLSHYGWIVILILILCLLISLATPFGTFIKDSALKATHSFVNLTYNTLGLEKPLDDGSEYLTVDNLGVVSVRPIYEASPIFKAMNNTLYNELSLSKKSAREYLAYSIFTGDNPSASEWKEMAISDSELKTLARDAIFEKSLYDEALIIEMTNNPNCTTERQGLLNLYYDASVDYMNMSSRASTQNVTEEELNQLWRDWATLAKPELADELKYYDDDIDTALNMFLIKEIITSDDDFICPEKITEEYVEKLREDYLIPKLSVDAYKNAFNAAFYNTDNLTYMDMIGLADPLLSLFTVDDCVAMVGTDGYADVNKAFAFITDGITLDEYMNYINNIKTLPYSFEIPQEINGIRVTKITQNSDFRDNLDIVEIRLPESVYSMEAYAFEGCENLEAINLQNIKTMGMNAFDGCKSLKKIELSPLLTNIPSSAFRNCKSLKEVIINEGTASVGYDAFYGCTSLEKITIPSTITSLNGNPFSSASNKLVIYGVDGSYAETFANTYGYAFVAI